MALKVGDIVLVDGGAGDYWVGEVKELVKKVWVKRSKMVGKWWGM